MTHSYLLIGTTFGRLISIIYRNGGISLRYIGRLLFLLQGSFWSSVFSIIENIKYKKQLKKQPDVTDPFIILGHWRTGSTFLHQLLSLDKQFTTPKVVRVSVPDSFMVSESYFRTIMKKVMGNTRPMDNVKLGPDEPQEDEYALLKIAKKTPLEQLIFPEKNKLFSEALVQLNDDDFTQHQADKLKLFIKKLKFDNPGKVLLKNPFHSLRITKIRKEFPDVRFIHIYRDPNNVIPSSVKMFNIIGKQNILKGNWQPENIYSITKSFNHIWKCIKKQLFSMPESKYFEIKYENFEQNPKKHIKNLYAHFGLSYSIDFDLKIDDFLKATKDYKKNKFNLTTDEINHIQSSCADFINRYY